MVVVAVPVTGSAEPSAAITAGVRVVVCMAARAVRSARLLRRDALSAQHVFSLGNRVEMIGINTGSITAEMIQRQSRCNRASDELVGNTMREGAFFADLKVSVTTAIAGALPDPALGSFDFDPEPFGKRHGEFRPLVNLHTPVSVVAVVMRLAPALAEAGRLLRAAWDRTGSIHVLSVAQTGR